MFRTGVAMLRKSVLPTLIVTDENTKGCPDFPASEGQVSPWESMVNSEGHSEKIDDNSLGSFGIGKHAPFAVTPLRTVLYSTCYENIDGKPETRFIGRSMLVSHRESKDSDYRSADGYLTRSSAFQALSGNQIPERWRMDSYGTLVAVPGFKGDEETGEPWSQIAFDSIVNSFFYAILEGNLQMVLERQRINKQVLLGTSGCQFDIRDPKTEKYILAAQKPHVSKYIEGIGDVKLHIELGGDYKRALALVRYPGLMITDAAKNMGEANPSIPPHWKPFTAVAFISPKDEDTVLKEAEVPSHDKISVNQVPVKNRKFAKSALLSLADFLYDEIKKVADTDVIVPDKGASELDKFDLFIEDDSGGSVRQVHVTGLKQLKKAPKIVSPGIQTGLFETPTSEEGCESFTQGESGGEGVANGGEESKTTEQKPQPKIEMSAMLLPVIQNGQTATHKMSISISTFEMKKENSDICLSLLSLGEDEKQKQIGIMQAICGEEKLATAHRQVVISESLIKSRERIAIDIQTNEPVTDKTFALYCEKKEKLEQ